MHYFYLPPAQWPEDTSPVHPALRLEGSEAHHLLKVLRLGPGEEITLLDGQGREALCRVETPDKRGVPLSLIHDFRHPRPQSHVILAAAWGKAARRGYILEKAVEFEASALWFWQAERSQFPLPDQPSEAWLGQLVAGAKQCCNPWLPHLRTLPRGVKQLIQESVGAEHKQLLLEKDYAAQGFLDSARLGLPGTTICVVGPEGGFSPVEVELLRGADFVALSMGDRILRWESAAIMALGLHWWKRNTEQR